jgi:3-oxosteroid 1-dehydrogenase
VSDPKYDLVIVGSGAGAIAAGIKAKLLGIRPVVLEKTPLIGGSSIMSGGVLWFPNNPLMKREGIVDSREAALRYMENFVGKDELYSTPARREAFVDHVEEFVTCMEAQGMKYGRCPGYADYYEDKPGGNALSRSLEASLFDLKRLGEWYSRIRMPQYPVPIRMSEASTLMRVGITFEGKIKAVEVAARLAWARVTGKKLVGTGGALQGRMIEIALKLGVEIWTEAALIDFGTRNGRVEEVHIRHMGLPKTVRAARGVLVAAGGFSRNTAMRQKYQSGPISDAWTLSNPGDTGEAILAMGRAGAGFAVMDAAWWNTSWRPPGGGQFIIVSELTRPHGILVDHGGKRICNETTSYMEVGRAIFARHAMTPAIPAWQIMDSQARKRYPFAFQPPGRVPEEWVKRGWIMADPTLAGLAQQCGIDAAGLRATVERFNQLCATGVDVDYGRGGNAYQRYFGDPSYKNPSMGPISKPPFWAVPIWPGDVGTGGGVIANERAEVLGDDGNAIDGLYAAGNCTASLCGPHYVGAGQSIGASSIFGYIAAKQAAVA